MHRLSLPILLIAFLCGCVVPVGGAAPAPIAIDAPISTPTFTPLPRTPIPNEPPTPTPKPAWQATVETQDPRDNFFKVVDGKPVFDLYDITTQETINLVSETIKITNTTDVLYSNILAAQDADGNNYAFNPDHGWFKIPEVNMDCAHLEKYTEVDEDYFYDGRNNIVRALNYVNSPDKIPNSSPIFWVTAIGNISNQAYLSFFPVERVGEAQKLWPDEYKKTFGVGLHYVLSGFLKVNLKAGGYIYVMDRTIAIDETHTTGFANGFDPETYRKIVNDFDFLNKGLTRLERGYDLVTILPPPDQLSDGSPINFDPNRAGLERDPDPIVASLQGSRGSLISLLDPVDQQRIMGVLTANQYFQHVDGALNKVTTPLTDPSMLAKLANRILLSTIAAPF